MSWILLLCNCFVIQKYVAGDASELGEGFSGSARVRCARESKVVQLLLQSLETVFLRAEKTLRKKMPGW